MQYTIKRLEKSTAEIRVELSPEEVRPHLEEAAARISQSTKIPGFRPGHASYDVVEKRVGATKIMEEALEPLVRRSFVEAVMTEKLEPLGSPGVHVEKMTPGAPLVFKLTISLLPEVKRLADYTKIKVVQKPVEVKNEAVEKIVRDIQKMRAAEMRSTKPISETDHVVLDLTISQGGKPVGGGTAPGHHVVMDEPYYIPGFTEALRGMREGEEKIFTLEFPKEHYQKGLAGKPIDFKVMIKEVYTRELPKLDEVFAGGLGKTTMDEVRAQLRKNLAEEGELKETARAENAILDELVRQSQFDDIPELLVGEEVERMRSELEASIARQGLEWNKYLEHLGKSEAQLKLDFAPQAVHRVKAALAVREVAAKEEIRVSAEEINAELDRTAERYKDDKKAREHIYSPAYREQATATLKNRKTVARLKELATK